MERPHTFDESVHGKGNQQDEVGEDILTFSLEYQVIQCAAEDRDRQDQTLRIELFAEDQPDHSRRKENVGHHHVVVEPVVEYL